jgi:Fur family transcriptional regulator, ferric uptake regulator
MTQAMTLAMTQAMTQAAAPGPLCIRSCGVQYAGELARLHASLTDEGWGVAGFRELLAHPGALAFAAGPGIVSTEILPPAWGFIVGRVAADEAEVLAIGVARERQRLGIGRRLVDRLCRAALRRGARQLYLEVAERNVAARTLYARLGFEETGRRRGYYVRTDAPAEDAIILRLTLEAAGTPGAMVDGPRSVAYKQPGTCAVHEDMRASPSPANRIEKLCADKRLRMTGQRRVIARVLSDAKDHPDVEEVHRRAHAVDRRISLSTVYRTLRLFETKGILERHDFGAGRGRYEAAARTHHDHLIDLQTGRVIEFSNEQIERLQQRVAEELGFKLVGHKLELYGVPVRRTRK